MQTVGGFLRLLATRAGRLNQLPTDHPCDFDPRDRLLRAVERSKQRLLNPFAALIIAGAEVDSNFARAAANIAHIDVLPQQGANVYDILNHDVLAITTAGVEGLKQRLARTQLSVSADGGSGSSTGYSEAAADAQAPTHAPPNGGDDVAGNAA